MKAEIVSVGTELLLGQITDTNAPYLAQHLSLLGIDCYYISQLGDNLGRLADHLRRAFDRSDLIVMTGGLGPTEDDLTREGISELLGEPMVVQPDLEAYLRAWFKRRGVEMPERNVKQATLIASAQALPNPLGTAPGWWVEKNGRIIVAMPGVPHEMYRMWEEEVLPRLRPFAGGIIYSRTLKVFGKGESAVEEAVRDYIHETNPTLATYAKDDGIHLRMTAKADSREQAAALVDALEPKLRAILGDYIYGIDNQSMEEVVVGLLEKAGKRVAIFDALSGGWLANLITNVRGVSKVFPGGLVVELGALPPALVPPEGAVSAEGAIALAREARRHFGADIGLGLSGVGGPGEWEGKPAGTVFIALDSGATTRTQTAYYQTTRRNVKRLSALMAVNLLRLHLLGIGGG